MNTLVNENDLLVLDLLLREHCYHAEVASRRHVTASTRSQGKVNQMW